MLVTLQVGTELKTQGLKTCVTWQAYAHHTWVMQCPVLGGAVTCVGWFSDLYWVVL